MRFDTFQSLARAAGAVLFFVGPRRQTTLGMGQRNREDCQTAPGRSWGLEAHGATKATVDQGVRHDSGYPSQSCSGLSLPRWTQSKSGAQHSENFKSPLSPANFETWLRDTVLVDVDDNRFKIAVPNGFAKDWLETRYRSLISQTLARIVGYSVQVEFFVRQAGETGGANGAATGATASAASQPVRLEPTRVGAPEGAAQT